MKKIYLATNNPKKVLRYDYFFKNAKLKLEHPGSIGGMPFVEETENTYEGNARLKAIALSKQCQEEAWILSDDSGLEVDFLNGQPGVHTAYFGGPQGDARKNNAKLLEALDGVSLPLRTARFVCCLFLLNSKTKEEQVFYGYLKGKIQESYDESLEDFWGYQPLFIPEGEKKPLEFLPLHAAAHRIRALDELFAWLKPRLH